MGDSISTYHDYNPADYSVYYDRRRCALNELNSAYDCWWAQVNQFLRAYLCVNNSYSGSKVSGTTFPAACSRERTSALHQQGYSPDIILAYIGFNDFGCSVPVFGNDQSSFEYSYEIMLSRLKARYPRAWIFCGTLMKSCLKRDPSWEFPAQYKARSIEEYNHAIRIACQKQECLLADLASLNRRYETLDGTHPTANGHKTLAECWIACLRR